MATNIPLLLTTSSDDRIGPLLCNGLSTNPYTLPRVSYRPVEPPPAESVITCLDRGRELSFYLDHGRYCDRFSPTVYRLQGCDRIQDCWDFEADPPEWWPVRSSERWGDVLPFFVLTQTVIRFAADGKRGRVLGLGLSHGNLDLLLALQPIVFDLAEFEGGEGTLVITLGDILEVTQSVFPDAHTIGLTRNAIESLRHGMPHSIELDRTLGVPGFADALIFAGATERACADMLREAGLIPNDYQIDWTEYDQHEANLVEDCHECKKGRSYADYDSIPRADARPQRDWLRWIIAHPSLLLIAILALCFAVGLPLDYYKKQQKAERAEKRRIERTKRIEQVRQKIVLPDQKRRSIVKSRPDWLFQHALQPLNCPFEIRKLRTIRGMPLFHHEDEDEAKLLEDGLKIAASGPFDVIPVDLKGVGPVTRRLHRDDRVDQLRYRPSNADFALTFIVHDWVDVQFVDRDRYIPGLVRGQLLVWYHNEEQFVCASPVVSASTPQLYLKRLPRYELRPGMAPNERLGRRSPCGRAAPDQPPARRS